MIRGKQLRRTRRSGSSVFSEQLERRMLLAVTAAEYDNIREWYPAFNLPADMADANVIEIIAADLSLANLNAAISTAGTTNADDLIVVRPSATQNTITYTGSWDEINIDIPSSKGAVSIVNYNSTSTELTLDAACMSRVLSIGSAESTTTVNLGGISITGGQTDGSGGGIYQAGGHLTMQGVTIYSNTAAVNAGGLFQEAGETTLNQVWFGWNSAGADGGGMYLHSGVSDMTGVHALENSTSGSGGGIYVRSGLLTIAGAQIQDNAAAENGGGLCIAGGDVNIASSYIEGNWANHDAGGLYQFGDAVSALTNVVITSNSSPYTAGMAQNGGDSTLTNVSIAQNNGGGISLLWGNMTLNNSLVAQNADFLSSRGWDILYWASPYSIPASLTGHNNLIGNGDDQTALVDGVDGNLVGTASAPIVPVFVDDFWGGQIGLAKGSVGIDAGDNALLPEGTTTDITGRERIISGTVDIGAYEYGLDLVIDGTAGDDQIAVTVSGETSAERMLDISVNGITTSYAESSVESVVINGLAGHDSITFDVLNLACTISGGAGNDFIQGGYRADSLRGDDGNDTMGGGAGDDTIMGNTGDDSLLGAEGDDLLQGGLGNDALNGGIGDDTLYGGDGIDLIEGDGGNDHIEGRGKADAIHGGAGNDTIYGGAGADLIYGDDGDDQIDVGHSSVFVDSVHGGAGNDSVLADASDVLDADIESVVLA